MRLSYNALPVPVLRQVRVVLSLQQGGGVGGGAGRIARDRNAADDGKHHRRWGVLG